MDSVEHESSVFRIDANTEFVIIDTSKESPSEVVSQPPGGGYEIIGGLAEQIQTIRSLIEVPQELSELFSRRGKVHRLDRTLKIPINSFRLCFLGQ
jgi:hypothetical protein